MEDAGGQDGGMAMGWEGLKRECTWAPKVEEEAQGERAVQKLASGWRRKPPPLGGHSALPREEGGGPRGPHGYQRLGPRE